MVTKHGRTKNPTKRAGPELDREGEILLHAEQVFARYGFRRTSMAEVAREVEMSRAGLYKRFGSKEALFRAVVASLHEGTLSEVDALADEPGIQLEERLTRIFDARMGFFIDRHQGSAHAGELGAETNRICGDVVADTARRFRRRLARLLREAAAAGELDLADSGLSAGAAADLAAAAVVGLKGSPAERRSRAEFKRDLGRWVGIFVRGLRPTR